MEVSPEGRIYLSSEAPVETPDAKPSLAGVPHEEAWFAGAGVRFCFLRLKDKAAVDRAAWLPQLADAWAPNLYVFSGDKELYVRMFAPLFGIAEDPATGSGAVALASVLAMRKQGTACIGGASTRVSHGPAEPYRGERGEAEWEGGARPDRRRDLHRRRWRDGDSYQSSLTARTGPMLIASRPDTTAVRTESRTRMKARRSSSPMGQCISMPQLKD
jgi:hypothetical protein